MPDVAGISRRAVEQLTVEHDPPPTPVDTTIAMKLLRPIAARPSLSECQSLGIEVSVDRQLGGRLQPVAQGEVAPGVDVERRDRLAILGDRACAADADHDRAHLVMLDGTFDLGVDQALQLAEDAFCVELVIDGFLLEIDHLAGHLHQSDGHLGAADVDGENDVHAQRG